MAKKAALTPARSNGKHPGGRPSKYTKTTLEVSREYTNKFEDHGDMIPSIAGLALVLKVSRETLYDWARDEDKVEFSDMLDGLKAMQEKVLINKGLVGEFNATIAKLVLAKHGYHDKQDRQITGEDGGPVKILKTDFKDISPKDAERAYRDFANGD